MKFINRIKELKTLHDLYKKSEKESQFLVLYGQRRIGKTELVKKFLEKKEGVYFLASKVSARENLSMATEQFAEFFGDKYLDRSKFINWREFFDYLGDKLNELKSSKPTVLVFDEFPFLASIEPGISSLFQYGWDEVLRHKNIFLILLGSSLSMMYKHVLAYSAPLYGRRTASISLKQFGFKESEEFLLEFNNQKEADFERLFEFYAIAGGVPAYLKEFDLNLSLRVNLEKKILNSGTFLNVEPELILSEEFDKPQTYLTILKAIGMNKTKSSEIATATNIAVTNLSFYLENLLKLRMIERQVPVTEKNPENTKKSSYRIKDPFLRFYFNFVFPNLSAIERGDYEKLFESRNQLIKSLVAQKYEEESANFILQSQNSKTKKLPIFNKLGRWWNKDTEIDLVGIDEVTNSIMFVETKWNNQKVDLRVLKDLQKKSMEVKWGGVNRSEYFVLISKSGFTKEVLEMAKIDQSLILILRDEVIEG
ncbi:MAG: ATP-binding protein [Patescibacteria group bacterium]